MHTHTFLTLFLSWPYQVLMPGDDFGDLGDQAVSSILRAAGMPDVATLRAEGADIAIAGDMPPSPRKPTRNPGVAILSPIGSPAPSGRGGSEDNDDEGEGGGGLVQVNTGHLSSLFAASEHHTGTGTGTGTAATAASQRSPLPPVRTRPTHPRSRSILSSHRYTCLPLAPCRPRR